MTLQQAQIHVSNEKDPGCLVLIGEYTTQLCGDYNKTSIMIPIKQAVQWQGYKRVYFMAHLGLSGHIDFHRIKQLLQFARVQLCLEDLRKKRVQLRSFTIP